MGTKIKDIPRTLALELTTRFETERDSDDLSSQNTLQELKDLISTTGIFIEAWAFDVAVADADPTAGKVRLNNADRALATFIYLSNANVQGHDLSEIINDLAIGSNIGIQQADNVAKAALYDVSGAIVDAGTYKKIPVTFKSEAGGGAFEDTKILGFSFIPLGGSVTGTNEPERIDFDTDLDNVYKTRYLTPVQITDITSNGISATDYSAALDDGTYDFASGVKNDTIANLNTYLDGLSDGVWVELWTNVVLSRASSLRRIVNLD